MRKRAIIAIYLFSTLNSFESHVPVKFIDEVYESLVENIEGPGGG